MPSLAWIEPWDDRTARERVTSLFAERFGSDSGGAPALVTAAPGRVNLIGEHTDYNGGLCLPLALPHATYAAASLREDGRFRFASATQDGVWEGGADDLSGAEGWAAYAAGVAWALAEQGHSITGLELAVDSTVPLGAGLSSSAALECASGLAVLALAGVAGDDRETRMLLARAGIRAENEVAGAATGGMDQTVAVLGEADHALLLDCRSWETRSLPFDPAAAGLALLVVDTRVHHQLNDGGYASRRADCEQAAASLGVETLREATLDLVAGLAEEQVRRRARHVVTEIARVQSFADALAAADVESDRDEAWAHIGRIMDASHASMRDDFEISCDELDLVVETALAHGALGARMTGGGFGGSAIALVPADRLATVAEAVDGAFADAGHRAPAYLPAPASPAARLLPA